MRPGKIILERPVKAGEVIMGTQADAWVTFGVTKSSSLSTISAANLLFLITKFILWPDRSREPAGDSKALE